MAPRHIQGIDDGFSIDSKGEQDVSNMKRRQFLGQAGLGLATVGAAGLVLRADAIPTVSTLDANESERVMIQMGPAPKSIATANGELKPVAPLPFGPFYKQGAPFRGKICPPFEPGTTFIMSGRVWAFDTKRPLPGVVIDIWHADNNGKYSGDGENFKNRGRLVSTESGYYEFESIKPVPYKPNPNDSKFWRCAHFHLMAVCPGYKNLVTEIQFKDDAKKDIDGMFTPSLAISVEKRELNGRNYEVGIFDIVLERETGAK
jgi:catechol 1,2-dioxygenase